MTADTIIVEVVYALPAHQTVRRLQVRADSTVREAIEQSGVLERHPEIDLAHAAVGIHGRRLPLDTALRAEDRVEIYRPLTADPKEARRRRART
jgi:putative ubiquitin-RnfH superfamily antitoxin RatB of RatAB toxin-antitoxin module